MYKLLVSEEWKDYELIDSGEGEKLERFGQYVMARPDPRAIWNKGDLAEWKKADAVFADEKWTFRSDPPTIWPVAYKKIKFNLRPTDFKHVGIFPEQAVNWDWINDQITNTNHQINSNIKILNLFAYTGGATMAAALAGATVTHVDASRPAMMWASENAIASGIGKDKIRWIQDDAMKFVQREIRRGIKYDGIIMDPPRFGRGAAGEIWKLEEDLPKLVWACKQILSETPLFWLINGYTADLSHLALGNLLSDAMGAEAESGELGLKESTKGRILPAGIWARWSLVKLG
jgi:23S rRNA (cytosine1962-C5)-methyltransferase